MTEIVYAQTKLGSLIEACINQLIGVIIAVIANILVLPAMLGITPSFWENVGIVLIFTAISVVRSYIVRRWFNKRLHEAAERLARSAQ